jgi:AraC-like DNA-binding protein
MEIPLFCNIIPFLRNTPMPEFRRYIGLDGAITEKFNEQVIQERMLFLTPQDEKSTTDFPFPVIISLSGSGTWGKDGRFRLLPCKRYAIELVTAGSMKFIQDGKEYEVEKGGAYFLRPGSISEYGNGKKGFAHKRFVILEGRDLDLLRERFGLTDCDIVTLDNPKKLARCMKKASMLLRDKPDDYEQNLSVLGYEIMLLLSTAVIGRNFPQAINVVLHFMNRNIHRMVTIEELCAVAGISRTHFHRIFTDCLGEKPHRYFSAMRIRHIAAQIRSSPNLSIGDIARENEFEDQAYFTNLFKKIMGVSPGKYRRGDLPE